MNRKQSGSIGGNAIKSKYGMEWFRVIGRLGNEAQNRLPFTRINACVAAGERTLQLYGNDHYHKMGIIGGNTTLKRYGREHYSRIAKLPRKRKSTVEYDNE